MTETFGPEYVKPAPRECPDCPCCSLALCEKGRTSLQECRGHPQSLESSAARASTRSRIEQALHLFLLAW